MPVGQKNGSSTSGHTAAAAVITDPKEAMQNLEQLARQHALPSPKYQIADSASKKARGKKEFVCRVDIGNFVSVTTYPSNYSTAEVAQERGAEKALRALQEKITAMTLAAAPAISTPNELLVDSKSAFIDRVYELVKTEPVGLLDVGIRDKYMQNFKQALPPTWLETIRNDGRFHVEVNKVYNRTLTTVSLKKDPSKSRSPLPTTSGDNAIVDNTGHNTVQPNSTLSRSVVQANESKIQEKDNVLSGGNKIPDYVVPVARSEDDFFDVFIPVAANPSNFFVQPYVQVTEEKSQSQKLQRDMKAFYDTEDNHIPLDAAVIKRGCYAAAKVNDSWRRVMITGKVPPPEGASVSTEVIVYSLDFGDIFVTENSNLQPLYNEFRQVPKLAINAELYDVRPNGSDWSPAACSSFTKMAQNKAFVSVVKHVSKEVNQEGHEVMKLGLLLIDTTTEEDIYISDLLIERDFAVHRT
jgi:hypothetical protein